MKRRNQTIWKRLTDFILKEQHLISKVIMKSSVDRSSFPNFQGVRIFTRAQAIGRGHGS